MVLEQYFVNQYLRAFIVFLCAFLITKIIFLITKAIFLKVLRKPELETLFLEKASLPMNLIFLSISLRFALTQLVLVDNVSKIVTNVIYSLIIIIASSLIYIFTDLIIHRAWQRFALRTKTKVDENLTSLIHVALKVALIVIAVLYILDLWGMEVGPLLAGLGIAGLAVALAVQPVLSNIFSGLAIILDKSIRAGDLIHLDADTRGKIIKVGLRSTRILTSSSEMIIIPNSKLAESVIQNLALPEPRLRITVPFTVAYGCDVEEVKKIVIKELKSVKNLTEPEPYIRFIEMADSCLKLEAYFYISSFENRDEAKDEANTKIYNILSKHKIEIPFPQMDVHLKK
ncbi:MAG: mechanosensitive ion channel family protein [Nanoarchaeota archaeon]